MLTENQQDALEALLTEYHNDPETGVRFTNEVDERVVNQESVLLAIGEDVKDAAFMALAKGAISTGDIQVALSVNTKIYEDEVNSQIREAVTDFIN